MEIKNIKKLSKTFKNVKIITILIILGLINSCSTRFTKESQLELKDPNTFITAFASHSSYFVYASNNSKIHCYRQSTYIGSLTFEAPLSTIQLIKIQKNAHGNIIQLFLTENKNTTHSCMYFFTFNLKFKMLSSFKQQIVKITAIEIGSRFLFLSTNNRIIEIRNKDGSQFQLLKVPKNITQMSQVRYQQKINLRVGFQDGKLTIISIQDLYQKDIFGLWNFGKQYLEVISQRKGIKIGSHTVAMISDPFKYANVGVFNNASFLVFPDFSVSKDQLTFTGWIFPFTVDNQYPIISNSNSTKGFGLLVNYQKLFFYVFYKDSAGESHRVHLQGNINVVSIWYFIAFTLDQQTGKVQLFINSQLVNSTQVVLQSFELDKQPFFIGAQFYGPEKFFNGRLDQFKFFNRVLTRQEIAYHQHRTLYTQRQSIFNNKITGIYDSKLTNYVYITNIDGEIRTLQTEKTYLNPASITLVNSFKPFDTKVNSLLQITQNNQTSVIISSQSLVLNEFNPNNITLTWNQSVVKSNTNITQSVFLSSLFQGKFYSAKIGEQKLEKWSIFLSQNCHQSCLQCAITKSETQCYSCNDFYLKIQDQSAVKGFRCVLRCPNEYNKMGQLCQIRNQAIVRVSEISSSILSTPNLRLIAKLFSPFYVFLQDMWFYKYHNREYSAFMNYTFEQIQRMNQLKIAPQLVKTESLDNDLNNLSTKLHQHYQEFIAKFLKKSNLKSSAFLANAGQILVYGFLSSIGCCFVILSMFLVVEYYNEDAQYQFGKRITAFLDKNCGWAILIAGFIETNMISLSFYCFNQLTAPFYSYWVDKINIMCAVMCLFLLLLYSCCFYILAYKLCSKARAENLLKYEQFSYSTFWQSIQLYSFKNILKGFMHGFVVNSYTLQICSLTTVCAFEIAIIIYFRKCYQKTAYFLFILGYQISFFLLNFIFLTFCFAELNHYITKQYAQIIQIYLISAMVACTILLVISIIFCSIYQSCQSKQKQEMIVHNIESRKTKTNKSTEKQTIKQIMVKAGTQTRIKLKQSQLDKKHINKTTKNLVKIPKNNLNQTQQISQSEVASSDLSQKIYDQQPQKVSSQEQSEESEQFSQQVQRSQPSSFKENDSDQNQNKLKKREIKFYQPSVNRKLQIKSISKQIAPNYTMPITGNIINKYKKQPIQPVMTVQKQHGISTSNHPKNRIKGTNSRRLRIRELGNLIISQTRKDRQQE